MHLKSLTLKGFKSFPDRTRLDFGPGVSVVVGPNGSGKSNVTDAVLWAMGEQSPLAVRGQSMQDVIFGGGRGVQARSAAEVEIVLDNSDGTVDLPLSEISIVRRLDRTGEGEYRLNGARCRLVDVIEVLSDTGLGKETHSVISQGRVEAIVTSKPRDRRLLIEEAAGLGKHRKRRRRAQLKLERTQENLDRALDVEREARTRLRPLKRQAEAAELHERLERQMLEARWSSPATPLRARRVELDGGRGERARRRARRAREVEARLQAIDRAPRARPSGRWPSAPSATTRSRAASTSARSAHERLHAARASRSRPRAADARAAQRARRAASSRRSSRRATRGPARTRDAGGGRRGSPRSRPSWPSSTAERERGARARARRAASASAQAAASARRSAERALAAAQRARASEADAAAERRARALRGGRARGRGRAPRGRARRRRARGGQPVPAQPRRRARGGGRTRRRRSARSCACDDGYELALAAALGGRLDAALVEDVPGAETLLDRAGPDGGTALLAGRGRRRRAREPRRATPAPVAGAPSGCSSSCSGARRRRSRSPSGCSPTPGWSSA